MRLRLRCDGQGHCVTKATYCPYIIHTVHHTSYCSYIIHHTVHTGALRDLSNLLFIHQLRSSLPWFVWQARQVDHSLTHFVVGKHDQ